jgi:hypothetical protein
MGPDAPGKDPHSSRRRHPEPYRPDASRYVVKTRPQIDPSPDNDPRTARDVPTTEVGSRRLLRQRPGCSGSRRIPMPACPQARPPRLDAVEKASIRPPPRQEGPSGYTAHGGDFRSTRPRVDLWTDVRAIQPRASELLALRPSDEEADAWPVVTVRLQSRRPTRSATQGPTPLAADAARSDTALPDHSDHAGTRSSTPRFAIRGQAFNLRLYAPDRVGGTFRTRSRAGLDRRRTEALHGPTQRCCERALTLIICCFVRVR